MGWALSGLKVDSEYVDSSFSVTSDGNNNAEAGLAIGSKLVEERLPRSAGTADEETNLKPQKFAEGDVIGSLVIPVLKKRLPLLQGTGTATLKKGVGHYTQSVMPGVKDNCVLSAHRDTYFRGIGKVKKGDLLIVQTQAGSFTYKTKGIRIVEADDKTVIVPTSTAVLTLTTCYPFNYVGNAPQRYIITADLIKTKK
jgi:sortase A